MARKNKVRRFGYERKRQRQKKITATLVMVLVLGAAAAVGWFAFDPIYDFVKNFDFSLPSAPPPGGETSGDTVEPPVTSPDPGVVETGEAFPATAAYLPPFMMSESNLSARLADLKAKGVEGVVFDLKDENGKVRYVSGLAQVTKNLAQEEGAFDLAGAIRTIRQAGLVPIGRLHAFEDHTAPAHMYESAVKYMDSNVNWIDDSKANGGRAWLNPANSEAQEYIIALVEEVAGAGLVHVILDGVQFPEGMSLHLATYGVEGELNKSAVLVGFLSKVEARAKEMDVTVWPVINLLSAAGLSDVRYGRNVAGLLVASGRGAVEAMPHQFGGGVTGENLTLSAPVLEPYETVKAALAAAALPQQYEYVAVVQAYTATGLAEGEGKPYGREEIDEQISALKAGGIQRVILYNAGGIYP